MSTESQHATEAPARPTFRKPKRGEEAEVAIESIAFGGKGIARLNGFVLFVPHVIPGERVRVRIRDRKKSYAEADLLEVLEPSPQRIEPVCPLFTRCGGCSWQHAPLEVQEEWNADVLREALHPIIGINPCEIVHDPLVHSPEPFHYRNKMEFTFGQEAPDAPVKLGFHMPGNWKHILNVERCWLHPEPVNKLLAAARAEIQRQGCPAWNPVKHEGIARQLVMRWSEHEGRMILAMLTGQREGFDFPAFCRAIERDCPEVKGILWGINASKSDVARAREVVDTWGENVLEERLGALRFQVSLASFFQTNTAGALELYKVAKEYLGLTGKETLLDAYCGTGSIGIFCADQARAVAGVELITEAIWDARANAALNGLDNCTFMAGDMSETLPRLLGGIEGSIDRVVVDPPRGGMDKKSLRQLVALRAPTMVYVSCNPSTMARDLRTVIEGGYRVERVRPVDMFPQTYHIECVTRCVLDR